MAHDFTNELTFSNFSSDPKEEMEKLQQRMEKLQVPLCSRANAHKHLHVRVSILRKSGVPARNCALFTH